MKLTRNELEIMDILWERGTATVRDVVDAIPRRKRPAYTTVQTVINRLEGKGAVKRTGKEGNAHLFAAVVTRPRTYQRMIREMVDIIGWAQGLVSHLVASGDLTLEDLKTLEEELKERDQ